MGGKRNKSVLRVRRTRREAGADVGIITFFGNLVLFAIKIFAGLMSNSISVVVDAFNSLLDSASNIVTVLGFRRAAKRADTRHPHGHGRIEYVVGFMISMVIIVTALGLGHASAGRILNPEKVEVSFVAVFIVTLSIFGKGVMAIYHYVANRKIKSVILRASMIDSFSDVLATTVALIGMVFSGIMEFPIDGFAGIAVAGFIFVVGIRAFFENFNLLIGEKPERKVSVGIRRAVLGFSSFSKVIKVEFHDYGPEFGHVIVMVSLASGVRRKRIESDIAELKNVIAEKYGMDATIYWAV